MLRVNAEDLDGLMWLLSFLSTSFSRNPIHISHKDIAYLKIIFYLHLDVLFWQLEHLPPKEFNPPFFPAFFL